MPPYFKLNYKPIVITELFDVSIETDTYAKWNRIDQPDINLHIYG